MKFQFTLYTNKKDLSFVLSAEMTAVLIAFTFLDVAYSSDQAQVDSQDIQFYFEKVTLV